MLNNYNFKSIFKNELNYFIKYKRSLGLKYENEIFRLHYIDNILHKLKIKNKIITKETFYEYKNIYYEEKKFKVINNYKPVIFNDREINLLFQTIDKEKNKHINHKSYKVYYSYSIIFRLLYSCGLRISEVLKIEIKDINFNENTINIINSKRHISRLVVFSNSMKQCLLNYINLFKIIDGLLFKNLKGNSISKKQLRCFYNKILINSNLNKNAHIHDLRHVFCNNAFNQMLEKGYNENVVIVYLYKYMGHKIITETEYYLHFTDYNKNKLLETNDTFSKELYEGVDLNNE